MSAPFDIVVAMDDAGGIGAGGRIPWHSPFDLRAFRAITTRRNPDARPTPIVIMGRSTFEGDLKGTPLPQRTNVVVSSSAFCQPPHADFCARRDDVTKHWFRVGDFETALGVGPETAPRFVIGGAKLLETAVSHPALRRMFITRVEGQWGCDTFMPDAPGLWVIEPRATVRDAGLRLRYETWHRVVATGP